MSKGRPRAAARQAPLPLPAIRPRSRDCPPAGPSAVACSATLLVPRASPGLHFLLPCLLAPSPITHVSTFSRHHATPRPALFPPSPWVSSHRFSRQDFFPPVGAPPPPHVSRISNHLGLKMQTHRKAFYQGYQGLLSASPPPRDGAIIYTLLLWERCRLSTSFLPRRPLASGF